METIIYPIAEDDLKLFGNTFLDALYKLIKMYPEYNVEIIKVYGEEGYLIQLGPHSHISRGWN